MKDIKEKELILGLYYDKDKGASFARLDSERLKKLPKDSITTILKAMDELRREIMGVLTDGKVDSDSLQVLDIRVNKEGFEVGYNRSTVDQMSDIHFKGILIALREVGNELIDRRNDQDNSKKYPGMNVVN